MKKLPQTWHIECDDLKTYTKIESLLKKINTKWADEYPYEDGYNYVTSEGAYKFTQNVAIEDDSTLIELNDLHSFISSSYINIRIEELEKELKELKAFKQAGKLN